ncbi:PKD domain-containing protein, partial [Candidatus Magnetomorum sp. HK-1]
ANELIIYPSDLNSNTGFGVSTSIFNNCAVIGSYSGIAYVFTKSNDVWVQHSKISPDDITSSSNNAFAKSVSIFGDYIIIGASRDQEHGYNSGAAYVFHKNNNIWTQQSKLVPSDIKPYDMFGISVCMTNGYAIIGKSGDDEHCFGSGAAYIYKLSDNKWTFQTKLKANIPKDNEYFGCSVSISDELAIVGASFDDGQIGKSISGSAYIFHREEETWAQETVLQNEDQSDEFGRSVSISNNYAIVGAYGNDNQSMDSGAAYIFKRNDKTWDLQNVLTVEDCSIFCHLGFSVSISNDYAIVGTEDNSNGYLSGSAYVYQRNDENWALLTKILPNNGKKQDRFGSSVSIFGNELFIGVPGNDDKNLETGCVYNLNLLDYDSTHKKKSNTDDYINGDIDLNGQIDLQDLILLIKIITKLK